MGRRAFWLLFAILILALGIYRFIDGSAQKAEYDGFMSKDYIEKKMFDARGEKEGEWLGDPALDVDKKITVIATLVDVVEVSTRFGMTQLVKFVDEFGNSINWWTSVEIKYEVGTKLSITGTIKGFDRYKNKKITVMKRCKLSEV